MRRCAPGRARPRLADRNARRREGARRALRDLSGRAALHAGPRARQRCRRGSKPGRSTRRSSSGCRARAGSTATTCRSIRWPSSCSISPGYDLVISSSHCAVKSVKVPAARCARLLLPLADALRLGPVRRLFRPGSGGKLTSRLMRPVMASWPAGTGPRRGASTAFSRTLNMLRGGSADTIIVGRPLCILL